MTPDGDTTRYKAVLQGWRDPETRLRMRQLLVQDLKMGFKNNALRGDSPKDELDDRGLSWKTIQCRVKDARERLGDTSLRGVPAHSELSILLNLACQTVFGVLKQNVPRRRVRGVVKYQDTLEDVQERLCKLLGISTPERAYYGREMGVSATEPDPPGVFYTEPDPPGVSYTEPDPPEVSYTVRSEEFAREEEERSCKKLRQEMRIHLTVPRDTEIHLTINNIPVSR